MTYGEKVVGLDDPPSSYPDVDKVKRLYAEIIDLCYAARYTVNGGERAQLFSVAINEAMTAQMWAVKALTWREDAE